jgi:septum formation protein
MTPDELDPTRLRPFQLVLASTSSYRRALLDQLRIAFAVDRPLYEEEHDLALEPEALVVELARKKAESLMTRHPESLILGSDQVAELDGRILGKPGSAAQAVSQLCALSGRTHRLLTGVALVDAATGRCETCLDVHHMTMRPLTPERLAAYVEREQPLDCAGAYKVEGCGIALFAAMRGEDYTGIIGLPLTRVVGLLERLYSDPRWTPRMERPNSLI